MRSSSLPGAPIDEPSPAIEVFPTECLTRNLADLLLHAVRGLLEKESPEMAANADLRVALRASCDRARNDGLRAEQLLLILKAAWRELPERQRLTRVEADVALARVVSACIEEYYLIPPMARERGEASHSAADHARADSWNAELR